MSTETLRRGLVSRNPDVHHGDAVFVGTRVPVQTLPDCLQDGYDLEEFLDDFPTVSREQALAALVLLRELLLSE
ncbi:MAG TPA: DUF433 domain-containing protein [Chloroflexota bacterium]|jgi:uncharacterized protein (DUF433 family)